MSNRIQQYIVQCDPGFVSVTDDGRYRLTRMSDDGTETTILMTPEEYAEEHPATTPEEFFAVLHLALEEMGAKQFVPASEVVDTLLDLRSLYLRSQEESKKSVRRLYDLWREAVA